MLAENISQTLGKFASVLSDKEFSRLSQFIHDSCGIKITPAKKIMLESRLTKRLKDLGIYSFKDYLDYLFSPRGMQNELVHMIDVVTTNKTDFFRESAHFSYLTKKAVPELMTLYNAGIKRTFNIWSAGCSTGEEPYTIAMVLNELNEKYHEFRYQILATDISTKVLDIAKAGIYSEDKVEPVPDVLKKKYILKGKNSQKGMVKVVSELRSMVNFRRLNFMEGDFGMRERMDIIFCRNVIIYFDKPTQEKLLKRFCGHLVPDGCIFMGHSETLQGMDLPLVQVAPTVYRKNR
jgi:chemotaxis protein methyltransferase CheR